jgi:hypothetical protein
MSFFPMQIPALDPCEVASQVLSHFTLLRGASHGRSNALKIGKRDKIDPGLGWHEGGVLSRVNEKTSALDTPTFFFWALTLKSNFLAHLGAILRFLEKISV